MSGFVFSSLSSLVKSSDAGNGVTFRSGDNVDLGPSHIGVSFIDTAMQMVSSVSYCWFTTSLTVHHVIFWTSSI